MINPPLIIDGGWYSFALPDGSWGSLIPGKHIQTSSGIVPLPVTASVEENVLFLDGYRLGGRLFMAGQGHITGKAWIHDGVQWTALATTFGTNPCKFGDGALYVAVSGKQYYRFPLTGEAPTVVDMQIGAQGIRQIIGGSVVTCDASTRLGELFEFTVQGDVIIGQGHEGGAWINDRQLEPGDNRFIRLERNGDRLSNAIVQQPLKRAVLRWFDRAEIDTLPTTPPVVIQPPPVFQPPSTEEPMTTPNRIDIAQRVAAQHPDLVALNTSTACGILTEFIALALNAADPDFGLLSKSPGEHNYRGHAVDAVIYRPTQQVIDLMSGAGDRDADSDVPLNQRFDIRIKWEETVKRDGNDWMAPIEPIVAAPVPPVVITAPPVVAPPADYSAIFARLDLIGQQMEEAAAAQARTDERLTAIKASLDTLNARTWPTYTGRVLGMALTLNPSPKE